MKAGGSRTAPEASANQRHRLRRRSAYGYATPQPMRSNPSVSRGPFCNPIRGPVPAPFDMLPSKSVRLPARAPTRMLFPTDRICTSFESHSRIRHARCHQRPLCESDLCYFSADRYFPLFAGPQRLARGNGPKSRGMRTAIESPGGISVAKSRTVGLNYAPQRRQGRRLNLPGWGAGIRTPEWRYQKPLPYHLATPQCRERRRVRQFARRLQLPVEALFCRSFGPFEPARRTCLLRFFRRCAAFGKPL